MSYFNANNNNMMMNQMPINAGAPPQMINPAAPGSVYTLGMNLPKVDPNNYSGNIHFGPASTFTGPVPANVIWSDPNAAAMLNQNRQS